MTTLADLQRHVGVPADGKIGPQTIAALARALGIEAKAHVMADPGAFFSGLRKLTGPLNQIQVDTVNGLLASAAHWPISWLADGLATAWHEARFEPVEEIGKGKSKAYGKPGKYGQAPYGRGLVQVTHDVNYEWLDAAAAEAGLIQKGELLKDFSLALRPDIAALALVKGMEDGAYTTKKLADYLPDEIGTKPQFVNARRIINGTDRAEMIAGYALHIQSSIIAGRWA